MTLRPMLDAIDTPAFLVAGDGVIVDANAVAVEATGGRRLAGRALASVLVAAEGDTDRAGEPASWLGTVVGRRRAGLCDAEGRPRPADVHVAPLGTGEDLDLVVVSPLGSLTAGQERDRTLRQFAEAEALAGLGSWEWDVVTGEVRWSEQLCRLVGADPETAEPSYEAYRALVHPDDRESWEADLGAAFASDEPFTTEHRIVRYDGEVRHVRARAAVVRDEDGQPLRMLGSALDVTEQHELQRRKDEFVSLVNHELRTPLTSISGALGLLVGGTVGELPSRAQRMLEIAQRNTERLGRLINDILDFERIASGEAEMGHEDLDIEEVVNEAVRTTEGRAGEADVQLVTDLRSPGRLVGDGDLMRQVLINLIGNAVTYSPTGETVTVGARREGDEVVLWVTDHGRGIPPEDVDRVFERFEQVDSSDARAKGGTGLGLALCKRIVEEHGGDIRADSEPGRGTTVVARLPAEPLLTEPGPGTGLSGLAFDDEADGDESPPAGEDAARVLVVEDDPGLAGVLAQAFRGHGLAVWVAGDGAEAERLAARVEPHALVLDLLLPDRDGFAVVASLRQHDRLRHIPLAVYTALDLNAEQRAALRLGPTECYTKSRVSPRQLEERVLALLRGVAR